jgi:hypothetical protein
MWYPASRTGPARHPLPPCDQCGAAVCLQFGLPAGSAPVTNGPQPMDEGGAAKLDKDSAPQLLALVKGKELLGTPLQVRRIDVHVQNLPGTAAAVVCEEPE